VDKPEGGETDVGFFIVKDGESKKNIRIPLGGRISERNS